MAAQPPSLACDAALSPTIRRTAYVQDGRHVAADEALLGERRRTAEGYLEAPAMLTRTGVFEYFELPDGSEPKSITDGQAKRVRMLRLPSEVFRADSLASLDRKPLTRGHPISRAVDAASWRAHAVGIVDQVRKADDGEHVQGRVLIQDAATVKAVEDGERQISCGYYYRREEVPGGQWVDVSGELGKPGQTYAVDVIQRDITGNHHAIVLRGRAGPTASILLDEAPKRSNDMDPEELKKLITTMIGDALKADSKARADAAAAEKAAADKAKADAAAGAPKKADETPEEAEKRKKLEEENAALKTAVDSLMTRERSRERDALIQAHGFEVATDAASYAGLTALDATEIKRRVLAKRGIALDAKAAPEIVNVAFDTATKLSPGIAPTGSMLAGMIAAGAGGVPPDPALANDAANAREAYAKASREAWKRPFKD